MFIDWSYYKQMDRSSSRECCRSVGYCTLYYDCKYLILVLQICMGSQFNSCIPIFPIAYLTAVPYLFVKVSYYWVLGTRAKQSPLFRLVHFNFEFSWWFLYIIYTYMPCKVALARPCKITTWELQSAI